MLDAAKSYLQLLTQSSNGERFAVLESYLNSDLLGLLDADDESLEMKMDPEADAAQRPKKKLKLRDRILAAILPSEASKWKSEEEEATDDEERQRPRTRPSASSIMAQQSTLARLVNAMASIKRGRDYLGEKANVKRRTKFHVSTAVGCSWQ